MFTVCIPFYQLVESVSDQFVALLRVVGANLLFISYDESIMYFRFVSTPVLSAHTFSFSRSLMPRFFGTSAYPAN
jgi:hypothetical protein